jgi:amino acid transporter
LQFLPEAAKDPAVITRVWTIGIILFLAIINWRGPHFSAKFAGIASAPTFFLANLLAILALPFVPAGLANIGKFDQSIFDVLRNTTGVLLALSGVEAIANMTGVMKNPEQTSRKALNLEVMKVVFTTVVLGIALNGLPENVAYIGQKVDGRFEYQTETIVRTDFTCLINRFARKLDGENYDCHTITNKKVRLDVLVAMGQFLVPGDIGRIYGGLIGLVYGLLLIFAGNTALIGITNICYVLARDNELPVIYTKLNRKYGVPIWGLITAAAAPILTVMLVGAKVEALASLYAIGVVGAIALNLSGMTLQVVGRERLITSFGAIFMGVLFVSLAFIKMEATFFALSVVVVGLIARAIQRYVMKNITKGVEPWLATGNVAKMAKEQILVPVYDEFDPNLFKFSAEFAIKSNKEVILLYIHDLDTVLEKNPRHITLNRFIKDFLINAKSIVEELGVKAELVYDFSDDIGMTINHYRKQLLPATTIITPHRQSAILDFLRGNICERILNYKNGQVLIYSNN